MYRRYKCREACLPLGGGGGGGKLLIESSENNNITQGQLPRDVVTVPSRRTTTLENGNTPVKLYQLDS